MITKGHYLAIRNDLDVYAYIKDVLDQLLSGSKDYASLRPDAWATSHPNRFVPTEPRNVASETPDATEPVSIAASANPSPNK